MSNVTATTFQITGTGSASATGAGGAAQVFYYQNLVPYAPMEFRGSFKHGISTTEFRSEDGSIIRTQPGNGIAWDDGTAAASITGTEISAGNVSIVLTRAGTGTVRLVGLPTSAAGLTTGDVWRNGAVLNIV
jgi:hypothetical protein